MTNRYLRFPEGDSEFLRATFAYHNPMANKYGEAAIRAARQIPKASGDALAHWQDAVLALYPTSPIAQKKGGPRGAFLGLCEAGLVRDVPAGTPSKGSPNKKFATDAVALLRAGSCPATVNALWREVTGGADIVHNSQMDVVLALWKNNLIVK